MTLQSPQHHRHLHLDHPLWAFVDEGVDKDEVLFDSVLDCQSVLGSHLDILNLVDT